MNYSNVQAGIITAFVLPIILHFGFSESCGNEIVTILGPLPGLMWSWIARYKMGGITPLGSRK